MRFSQLLNHVRMLPKSVDWSFTAFSISLRTFLIVTNLLGISRFAVRIDVWLIITRMELPGHNMLFAPVQTCWVSKMQSIKAGHTTSHSFSFCDFLDYLATENFELVTPKKITLSCQFLHTQ